MPAGSRRTFEESIALAREGRTDDECWPWPGKPSHYGYGRIGQEYAHREAYKRFVGPIPDGEDAEHICHSEDVSCAGGNDCPHRLCVNWIKHLETLSPLDNQMRGCGPAALNHAKDACDEGHPFTPVNTRWTLQRGRPVRVCRTCRRITNAAAQARAST